MSIEHRFDSPFLLRVFHNSPNVARETRSPCSDRGGQAPALREKNRILTRSRSGDLELQSSRRRDLPVSIPAARSRCIPVSGQGCPSYPNTQDRSGRGIYNRDTIAGIFHTRMIMPTSKMRYHTMRLRMRVRLKMGRRGRCNFMFSLFARRSTNVICAITFIFVVPSLTLSMTTFSMLRFSGLGD